jgi:hypothetical protein
MGRYKQMTDYRTEHDLLGERHVPAGKVRKRHRLWRVGLPVALVAAATTVLVVIYLDSRPRIHAITSTKRPSQKAMQLLTFDCRVLYSRPRLQWGWPPITKEWTRPAIPMRDLPESTVQFVQSLIEDRFLKGDWGDLTAANIADRFQFYLGIEPLEVWEGTGEFHPEVLRYWVDAYGTCDDGTKGRNRVAVLLVSADGTILYDAHNPYDVAMGCDTDEDGLLLSILDRPLDIVDPNGGRHRAPGTNTVYSYKPGEKTMTKVSESNRE